jgi:hypothetical protein
MFVMLFLMTILLLLMARPTKTIINRIPYIQADIQTNRMLLSVTDSIRKDLIGATGIEITITEIPVEIEIVEPASLIDTGIDPNLPATTTEPNEPPKPSRTMPIRPRMPGAPGRHSPGSFTSKRVNVINDPNTPVVSIDANDIEMLADVNDVNDIYVEPVDTMTTLLIKTGDKTIRYEFFNGIAKRTTTPAEINKYDKPNVWHIPKARLDMQVWLDNEKPYALEIATAIVRKINGRTRDTMSNSHVFFVKEQNR